MKWLIATALLSFGVSLAASASEENASASASAATDKAALEQNGGNKINYDDPNLAMSSGYVTEMPITCADEKGICAADLAPELPILNALYLVESVNAQASENTPSILLPSATPKSPRTSK